VNRFKWVISLWIGHVINGPRHTLCDYPGSLRSRTRFVSTQKTFHHYTDFLFCFIESVVYVIWICGKLFREDNVILAQFTTSGSSEKTKLKSSDLLPSLICVREGERARLFEDGAGAFTLSAHSLLNNRSSQSSTSLTGQIRLWRDKNMP